MDKFSAKPSGWAVKPRKTTRFQGGGYFNADGYWAQRPLFGFIEAIVYQ